MAEHWWRAYDGSIDHPKLLRLSDAMHRAWFTLQCIASANGGTLPPAADVALRLRMKPSKVGEWITHLVGAGLIDRDGDTFRPHNWDERQYKTDTVDPTAASRAKKYRDRKRDGRDATVTHERPDTEQTTETETDNSEADASGAEAPIDHRKRLFDEGLSKLARLTGKGPDACRSFVGKCLKAAADDAVTVLGLIEDAERNRVADPSAWIAARLKATGPPSGRQQTDFQRKQQATTDVTAKLLESAAAARSGSAADRVLPDNHGERSGDLRGGAGAHVLALPRAFGGGSG